MSTQDSINRLTTFFFNTWSK